MKCQGERNDYMLHYEQVFGNVFQRRESKCCAVLMKHRCKGKCEPVITLQMAQQLKTNNINVVPRQLYCRQCKANFSLLQTLALNSLNVKQQRKSSNQLAFHLPAYMHL